MGHNNKTNCMNFFIVIFVTLLSSCNYQHAEPEIYLIPKGFTGRVSIVFNQKNGLPIKNENNSRVYEISVNGICLTQFKPTYGITNRLYFYVDSEGNRISLPIYIEEHLSDGTINWKVEDDNTIGIFLDGTTGQYVNGEIAPFQEVLVSDRKNYNRYFTPTYKKQFEKELREATGLQEISIP